MFSRTMLRRVRMLFSGIAASTFVLSACTSDSLGPSPIIDPQVEGELTLVPSQLLLTDGDRDGFQVVLRTPDGRELSSFPNSAKVEWRSSRPAIAAVRGGAVDAQLPGEATITATVGGQTASAFVHVSPRPDALRPLVETAEGPAGGTLAEAGVRLLDEGGLPVANTLVRFSVEVGGGEVTPTEVMTSADGSARVAWRLGSNAGENVISASAAGVPTAYLHAKGLPATDRLRLHPLGGDDQEGEVDEVLGSALRVQVVDELGNPVSSAGVSWEFMHGGAGQSSSASQATLAAVANAKGEVSTKWRLGEEAGDQLAVARLDSGYEVWFSARAKPRRAFLVTVSPTTVDLGVGKTAQLTAEVRDRYGNLLPNTQLRWSSTDPAIASVDANTGRVSARAGGEVEVTASVKNRRGSSKVKVIALGPGSIRSVSGSGQTAEAGEPLPNPLTVEVRDASGQSLRDATVAWRVVSGGGELSQAESKTDASGRASVRWTLGNVAGVQQIDARVGTLTPVTFAASAQAGGPVSMRVTPSMVTLSPGESRSLTATPLDAAGNPVSGVSVSWTSNAPTVASVNSQGQVLAGQAGSARITASGGGVSGTANLTVSNTVSTVRIAPLAGPLTALGQQEQVQAQALDAQGNPMNVSSFSWTSRNPSSVSVDGIGRILAWGAGSSVVLACVVAACDSVTVQVQQVVSEVVVSAPVASVEVGESVQLTAQAKDPGGSLVPNVQVNWSSANPSVLSVNSTGRATGVAVGQATAMASANGHSGQLSMPVLSATTPPPPPPPPAGAPELPRSYVNSAYQAPSGNVIRVRQGDDLQAAINSAQRGDIIKLDAGAVFNGDYQLPKKPGSGWIVITTDTQLPPEGTRVTPQTASNYAKIVGKSSGAALWVRAGASQYRIMGIEVTISTAPSINYHIVKIGETGQNQNDLSEVPRDIILDRVYVHGQPNYHAKRGVEVNGSPFAIVDSWVSDIHGWGQDTQAVHVWNAPGPFKINNNHLAAAGENLLFGGVAPTITNLIPSDAEIRGNHLYKDPSWQATGYQVKNLFEIKLGQRALFEGNVLENNWVNAQVGFAILLQSVNDNGPATWGTVAHVTIRHNLITNSAQGVNVLARNNVHPVLPAHDILIEHNVFDRIGNRGDYPGQGRLFQVLDEVHNTTIRNNSGISGQLLLQLSGNPMNNFVFTDNVVWKGLYGIKGNGKEEGTASLNTFAPGAVVQGNALGGAASRLYPSGNFFPSTLGDLGFGDWNSGNYSLSSSQFSGRGADWNTLMQKISGVVVPGY